MIAATLLVIEDEPGMRESLVEHFAGRGFRVLAAATGAEGLRLARANLVDVFLLDQCLPDTTGLEILRKIRSRGDEAAVVVITAHGDVETAVAAMKAGATDFLLKPFDLADLTRVVERSAEGRRLGREAEAARRAEERSMRGESAAMDLLRRLIDRVAPSEGTTVLVTGETGSGKELVADLLHRLSPRANRPLVKVNCGALPEALLEAEIFGHERGAFTGASERRRGLFELADGGTLFLDEIAEMPLPLQPALLRVLDGAPFRRLGGTQEIRADVRFVAATNRDLAAEVAGGRFREDLYHRIAVVAVEVPPLRARTEDIPLLARDFLDRLGRRLNRIVTLTPEAAAALSGYRWPGNVRELRNVLERTALLSDTGRIETEDLPTEVTAIGAAPTGGETLEEAKRRHVLALLDASAGNRTEAARRLGISRSTLKEILRRYRGGEASSAERETGA